MKNYSTVQVARMLGVHKVTLQRWLLSGKIAEPRRISYCGLITRFWTPRDVERTKKYMAAHYMIGLGKKNTA